MGKIDPDGPPASPEVALAGKDGAALARLVRTAKARGVKLLTDVVSSALASYRGSGPLLSDDDVSRLAEGYAAVNTYASLLGRTRVREMADRASSLGNLSTFADEPLSTFAEPADALATPEAAVDYFLSLTPSLGIDPEREAGEQRRRAFTLAASTNDVLTRRVKEVVAKSLRENASAADSAAAIRRALDAAGVSARNPQYAEMVYRTNAMDAFQTGVYEEGRHPDVRDLFPAWQYLGIRDGRQGPDHEPKFDRYYPASAAFADVRGDRPYNCRCSLRWVDRFEWDDLRDKGARLETRW